jgi:hypothetical protein
MTIRLSHKFLVIGILFVLVLLYPGCRSVERLFTGETMSDMTEDKLVSLILDNDINYESLFFRRLMAEVDFEGQVRSFRANMYIRRDSGIIVSVTPIMGIEMFRIMFGKENVYVVDRLNRQIFTAGYADLQKRFHVDFNYTILEGIFTNSLFAYPDNNVNQVRKYYGANKKDFYQLSSMHSRAFDRHSERGNSFILHQLDVLPGIYKVSRSFISRPADRMDMSVEYSDFSKLSNKSTFPTQIQILGSREGEVFRLKLNFSDVEVNGRNSISFRLPANYEMVSF